MPQEIKLKNEIANNGFLSSYQKDMIIETRRLICNLTDFRTLSFVLTKNINK